MTVVIIAGGIDLSVGTGIALCTTVLASALLNGMPAVPALLLTLLAGTLLGASTDCWSACCGWFRSS